MIYALKNQATSETFRFESDELPNQKPRPSDLGDKIAYRAWCHHPKTDHCFFSGTVGENAGQRVSKSNPAKEIHALVGDWDTPSGWENGQKMDELVPPDLMPNWISKTYSGGLRAVWILETPINCWDVRTIKRFREIAMRDLKCGLITGGFDRGAWLSPYTYYELGTEWRQVCVDGENPKKPLAERTTMAWLSEAVKAQKISNIAIDIPIEEVAKAVHEKFPGKWQGEFMVGARGCRFWDADSGNQTATIVRPDGMTYFSDGGGFKSWASIFGGEWARKNASDALAQIVDNLWYDGKDYYVPAEGVRHNWLRKNQTTMARYLKAEYNLSTKVPEGEVMSPIERALYEVEKSKFVDAILPCVYFHSKVVELNGRRILNSSSKRPVPPVDEPQPWGEKFPFIAKLLDSFFWDDFQKRLFLAWTAFMYQHAHDGNPHNGQNMFLVGPPGKGKTLITDRLIGKLMGGCQEAANFLQSKDIFSGALFENGIWTVNDESASTNPGAREKFSAVLKRTAANTSFELRSMYQNPCPIEWFGRVMLTANDDPESLRMLPQVDLSNADKLIALRCSPDPIDFPDDPVSLINEELPYFARWLYDHEMPEDCRGDNRYGTKCFCDPTLLEEIHDQSTTTHLLEVIEMWRTAWFAEKPGVEYWAGNLTELLGLLGKFFDHDPKLMEGVNRNTMGRNITKAISSGIDWITKHQYRVDGKPVRVYRIERPEKS